MRRDRTAAEPVCPRCGATIPTVVYGFGGLQPTIAMSLRCWSRLRELDCLLVTRRAA